MKEVFHGDGIVDGCRDWKYIWKSIKTERQLVPCPYTYGIRFIGVFYLTVNSDFSHDNGNTTCPRTPLQVVGKFYLTETERSTDAETDCRSVRPTELSPHVM